ncbi:MAG TPA: branched-chain amino acid ABC transporter permease [Baekduia sp.]|uniref:branched-chain amino acid ABC transporter permease n=1 Tax=Baekduia sp. TaxID=2600305 RepID=UPI002CE0ACFB|nr:branched-chain amino acid ABC transporter permease [Baekduia sp.]HMJ37851.1 branched-chain amino acid ABC transporter permease [Baekduia sp.]
MHRFLEDVIVPGLSSGALYALIAIGFALLFRVTGVLNFAHGNLVMVAPIGVLVFHEKWGLPVVLAYVLAVVATLTLALVQERIAIRPFLKAGSALPWIVSTLGCSVILAELLAIPFHGESRSFAYGLSARPIHVLGLTTTPADVALISAALVVAALLGLLQSRTDLGLRLAAVSQDLLGATAIGIRSDRMSQIAAGAAAVVAMITGLLVAPSQLVSSDLGLSYLFYGFVAASLGGLGSVPGALLGGMVIGIGSQAAGVYIGSLFVNMTLFGGLLVLYLLRPHGLLGRPALRAV